MLRYDLNPQCRGPGYENSYPSCWHSEGAGGHVRYHTVNDCNAPDEQEQKKPMNVAHVQKPQLTTQGR